MVNFKDKTTIIFFKYKKNPKKINKTPDILLGITKTLFLSFVDIYKYTQQICIISDQNTFSLVTHDKL